MARLSLFALLAASATAVAPWNSSDMIHVKQLDLDKLGAIRERVGRLETETSDADAVLKNHQTILEISQQQLSEVNNSLGHFLGDEESEKKALAALLEADNNALKKMDMRRETAKDAYKKRTETAKAWRRAQNATVAARANKNRCSDALDASQYHLQQVVIQDPAELPAARAAVAAKEKEFRVAKEALSKAEKLEGEARAAAKRARQLASKRRAAEEEAQRAASEGAAQEKKEREDVEQRTEAAREASERQAEAAEASRRAQNATAAAKAHLRQVTRDHGGVPAAEAEVAAKQKELRAAKEAMSEAEKREHEALVAAKQAENAREKIDQRAEIAKVTHEKPAVADAPMAPAAAIGWCSDALDAAKSQLQQVVDEKGKRVKIARNALLSVSESTGATGAAMGGCLEALSAADIHLQQVVETKEKELEVARQALPRVENGEDVAVRKYQLFIKSCWLRARNATAAAKTATSRCAGALGAAEDSLRQAVETREKGLQGAKDTLSQVEKDEDEARDALSTAEKREEKLGVAAKKAHEVVWKSLAAEKEARRAESEAAERERTAHEQFEERSDSARDADEKEAQAAEAWRRAQRETAAALATMGNCSDALDAAKRHLRQAEVMDPSNVVAAAADRDKKERELKEAAKTLSEAQKRERLASMAAEKAREGASKSWAAEKEAQQGASEADARVAAQEAKLNRSYTKGQSKAVIVRLLNEAVEKQAAIVKTLTAASKANHTVLRGASKEEADMMTQIRHDSKCIEDLQVKESAYNKKVDAWNATRSAYLAAPGPDVQLHLRHVLWSARDDLADAAFALRGVQKDCARGVQVLDMPSPTRPPTDTGGTCRIFGCHDSRHAKCVDHKCVCGEGTFAKDGVCVDRGDPLQATTKAVAVTAPASDLSGVSFAASAAAALAACAVAAAFAAHRRRARQVNIPDMLFG